jgi:hypothetical protein
VLIGYLHPRKGIIWAVEIETQDGHKQKGLATALYAAALVLFPDPYLLRSTGLRTNPYVDHRIYATLAKAHPGRVKPG